ncbi:MAG: RHS domain-containing protein [Gammaproteobacteria bacterium]|nr:RHS domain-containing protein [Gammaproteobacteria bacterium]
MTQSLQIKSGSTQVFRFSTAKSGTGSLQKFSSVAQAKQFLQTNFTGIAVSDLRPLAEVYRWVGGAAVQMQIASARAEVLQALAEALQADKLFLFELALPNAEISSEPSLSSAKPAPTKAANPGGRAAEANTAGSQQAAVCNDSGTNASDVDTPDSGKLVTCGDPVAMCNGEEILELTDFTLPGDFALAFKRCYRSSQSAENIGLGYGWRSNFHQQIVSKLKDNGEAQLILHNEEGRRLPFAVPEQGQTSYQLAEALALRHENDGSLVLFKPDNTHWVFVPVKTATSEPARWALHRITDSLGHVLQLYYDKQQRLSRIDYSRKRAIELFYTKANLLCRIEAVAITEQGLKSLDTTLAQYHYDEQADLIAATDVALQTEHYGYKGHLLAVRQRASGFKHYFSWLGEGPGARCARNWGDDGYYDYKFDYDDSQRMATSTDSRGQRWQYFHDERNQLIKKVAPDGATTLYSWNNLGKKSAQTEPGGATTRYYYNEHGQLSTIEQADGAISHFQYNELGQRCGYTDAEGRQWRREYTVAGLLLAEYGPDGSVSRYQYNDDGKLSQLQHADGRLEQYLWDEDGQLLARKQGEAIARYSYDKLGRLNGVADASGLVTEYQRNSAGKLLQLKQYSVDTPEHVVTEQLEYDSAGRLSSKVNALGFSTRWQYEGLSQPVAMLMTDGSALNYDYDKERNLSAIMRSDGARYQLDYDGLERPVKLQGFDGRVQQYQYDLDGNVVSVADGTERQIKLKRDKRGRIVEQTALHQQQLSSNHFYYDKLGRPLRANNAARKLRFSYHANGQLSEHWQDDWRTLHQYNSAGQRLNTTLADGTSVDFRYNEQGLLAQLALNQQPVMWRSFDAAGRETAREYQNGLQLNQQFDAFNRLTAQQWQHGGSSHNRQYSYSVLHQLISVTDNRLGNTAYQYNELDQLVSKSHSGDSAQNEAHQWDSFGNPSGDGIVVKQDRLLQYQANHYQYDDSGNQTAAIAAGKRQQREYNGFNQLTALSNTNSAGAFVTRYEYDAFGRRSAKITANGRTDYLWDANQLIGEYYQGEYRWYLYEPGSNKPLALVSGGQLYFYQTDHLGTPLSLTDSANNIVWRAHYTVFGKATVTVNDIDNPIRFQGQYYDSESGLHYNHFRYYDPQTGRFISQDPIGLLGGINHYQYAPNHINWVDPLGLCAKEDGDSYEARKAALANSNGAMTTLDAFSEEHATGEPWNKAAIDENWIKERQQLHKQILDTATTEALARTQTLVGAPAIHAMRGNTGAGKSRLKKSGVIPELAQGDIPVINPDDFKPVLINEAKQDGIDLTHNQTHWEAAMLSDKLKTNLLKPENNEQVPSIIVDKRLGGLYEVENLHKEALETGRQLNVFDVDAPLEMSLLGVLLREPGGDDPIVPFDVVAGGFISARGNREQFVQYYEKNPSLGRYELYHTLPDGNKELAAVVFNGKTSVTNFDAYEELTKNPKLAVDDLTEKVINDDEIARVTSSLPEGKFKTDAINALSANKGKTWKQAIDQHGKN